MTPEKFNKARYTVLDFYPDAKLWELGQSGSSALVSYLVPESAVPILLNGQAQPIHEYNELIGLHLSQPGLAASYLDFFCHYVWGDLGAFVLITDVEQLPFAARERHRSHVLPLDLLPVGENFETRACVHYGEALYEAQFRISPNGSIEMVDDEPLATIGSDVVYADGARKPVRPPVTGAENWPLGPPIKGHWHDASAAELQRLGQLILLDSAKWDGRPM